MANERRLIDANALKAELRKSAEYHEIRRPGYYSAITHIDEQPTVAAVEVVRCGECEHYRHYGKTSLYVDGKNMKAGWCRRRIKYDEEFRVLPCDFCSYGKRGEKNDA